MTIQLVTRPFARIVAQPVVDPAVLGDFIAMHDLDDVADNPISPIARLERAINGPLGATPSAPMVGHSDQLAEFAGRFCYRAWGKGRETPAYLANVVEERHGNVLAHSHVSFIVTGVSRALTHELVRHHVGTNPSQESQRYVTAESGELEVKGYRAHRAVVPPGILTLAEVVGGALSPDENPALATFRDDYMKSFESYHYWLDRLRLGLPESIGDGTLKKKRANEAARAFLPNAAETRLVWTMNLRAARHVIERRGDIHADLEIRRLAVAFTHELKRVAPHSFADAEIYTADDGFEAVRVAHYGV